MRIVISRLAYILLIYTLETGYILTREEDTFI